jgi:hypothetical protein
MMRWRFGLEQIRRARWAAMLLALAGFGWYARQAWVAALTVRSSLDEGNYLYKGYLFATGVYQPYAPYSPWLNKMPLSFLIPGWVQVIFGPGLRTGRIYAFVIALLLILALWLATRRMAGHWWGAFALWALALNPMLIKTYAQALSQGLAACLLLWACVLMLGDRQRWQLWLGAVLLGMLTLTRENMVLAVPFLLLYVFWRWGWRIGLSTSLVTVLALLIGHAAFWPGILRNWAKWLPAGLTPFLDAWRQPKGATRVYIQEISFWEQVRVFFEGARDHFLLLLAPLFGWLSVAGRRLWRCSDDRRLAVVLTVMQVVLVVAHLWASIGMDYCVYCYTGYLAFFSPVGLLLAGVLLANWNWGRLSRGWEVMRSGMILVGGTLLSLGVMFSQASRLPDTAIYRWLEPWLFDVRVPRFREGRFQPGTIELWKMLVNKFALDGDQVRMQLLPLMGAVTIGLLVVITLFLLVLGVWLGLQRRLSFAVLAGAGFLLLGSAFSTTVFLGGGPTPYDCAGYTVSDYEAAGHDLAERIPSGSIIDWRAGGGLSPALLLYLPGVQIYPPQLNGSYSFRQGGETDALFAYGYWNDELSQQFMNQADFLIVAARPSIEIEAEVFAAGFRELAPPPPLEQCPRRLEVRLFAKPEKGE